MENRSTSGRRTGIAGFILCISVFLVYSNSFNAAWQFDDLPNITLNPLMHLEELDKRSLSRAMFASPNEMRFEGQRLYRPVAAITLAMNWYLGKDNVVGYHLVNTLVHLTTAFFLYLTAFSLLKAPNLPQRQDIQIHSISLLTALIWAIHPLQTQAVTYIIQRMAAMAALFTICGIYFYVRARLAKNNKRFYINLCICGGCYLLGIGSKENAALLPLSLSLVEIIFFQNLSDKKTRHKVLVISSGLFVGILALGTVLFYCFHGNPIEYMTYLYSKRPFTLSERLMTEARVCFTYLSLLFWPSVDRLSLIHSVPVSTSLWVPWTTLPSIAGVVALITGGLVVIRKLPLLAFGLLFFFLNHSVESTFIPLELIFEHRNYLPSLFLFLPIAVIIDSAFRSRLNVGRLVTPFIMLVVIVFLVFLGYGTYLRNRVWATPQSLWTDVLKKHPENPRPYQVLADHYKAEKRYDYALALLTKSLELQERQPTESRALSFNNLGNIHVDLGEYEQAKKFFIRAIQTHPRHEIARYNLIFVYVRTGDYPMALELADELLNLNPNHNKYHNTKGFILYKMGNFEDARKHFRRALQLAPGYFNSLINMGMTFSRLGYPDKADWFLRLAQTKDPQDTTVMFSRIDNALHAGNDIVVKQNIALVLNRLTVQQIIELLGNDLQTELLPYDLGRVLIPVRNQLNIKF